MSLNYEGRVALVTGAAQGIGRAVALKLAAGGAKVAVVDLNDAPETMELLQGQGISIKADVSDYDDWKRISASVESEYGRCDIVVNNAGIYPAITIDDLTVESWRRLIAINLDSVFFSANQFVPMMKKNQWGRFINLSSSAIGLPFPGLGGYAASKMGVIGFTRGLANDVADFGITANAVLPSLTKTPGTQTQDQAEEIERIVAQMQSIKHSAEPEDIASMISYLASEDARFITGQSIAVDGGLYKLA